MQMDTKLVAFLILSSLIFFGWWYIQSRMFPRLAERGPGNGFPAKVISPTPNQRATPAPPGQVDSPQAAAPAPPANESRIEIRTDYWTATISNRGGVITEWTMTRLPNGESIDPPNGVSLVSARLSESVGAPFRVFIPSDPVLEKELNSAVYEIKPLSDSEIILNKGEKREISFSYSNNEIEASKTLIFKGVGYEGSTGFDFDVLASVKRNGNPVETYVVIGPNFGDQSVREVNAISDDLLCHSRRLD
jgi:YidC/Oxa1 family membrane protein insertase